LLAADILKAEGIVPSTPERQDHASASPVVQGDDEGSDQQEDHDMEGDEDTGPNPRSEDQQRRSPTSSDDGLQEFYHLEDDKEEEETKEEEVIPPRSNGKRRASTDPVQDLQDQNVPTPADRERTIEQQRATASRWRVCPIPRLI
jgi:hypothetical protein